MTTSQKLLTKLATALSPIMNFFGYEPRYEYQEPDRDLHARINKETEGLRQTIKQERPDVPLRDNPGPLTEAEHNVILDIIYATRKKGD